MLSSRLVPAFLLLLCFVGLAHADLGSVRHERSGRGHHYLSTHQSARVGDIDVSLDLFVLDGRYVAVYTESRRLDAQRSEVLVERELAGPISGTTLASLGTARVLGEQKNGKPVVELTLTQPIASSPRGLTLRLAWTYGSYAPKSVTQ